jgi:hypothetical protein
MELNEPNAMVVSPVLPNGGGGASGGLQQAALSGGVTGQQVVNPNGAVNHNEQQANASAANIGSQVYLVGKFTGEDDFTIHQFIQALETAKSLGNWSDSQTLAVATLRLGGDALAYVEATPRVKRDWDSFKREMKEHFQRQVPPYVAERHFQQCHKLPNESVRSFESRLRLLGRRFMVASEEDGSEPSDEWQNQFEKTLLRTFCYGLKLDYRRYVLMREPKTMRDAVRFAQLEEANLEAEESMKPQNVTMVSEGGNSVRSQGQRADKTPGREGSKGNGWPRRGRGGHMGVSPRVRCFGSGNFGHVMSKCPDFVCRYCGEGNHRPRDCTENPANHSKNGERPAKGGPKK